MSKTRFKEDKETRKYIPFKHMVLEDTASRSQKCYLSYVNSVVVSTVKPVVRGHLWYKEKVAF